MFRELSKRIGGTSSGLKNTVVVTWAIYNLCYVSQNQKLNSRTLDCNVILCGRRFLQYVLGIWRFEVQNDGTYLPRITRENCTCKYNSVALSTSNVMKPVWYRPSSCFEISFDHVKYFTQTFVCLTYVIN